MSLDLEPHEAWGVRELTGPLGNNALGKDLFFCLVQEMKTRVKEVCEDVS